MSWMADIFNVEIPSFYVRDWRDYMELSMDDKYIVLMFADVMDANENHWNSDTWHRVWEMTIRYKIYMGMPAYSCATIHPPHPRPVYDTDVYGVIQAEDDALTAMKRLF